MIWKAFSLFTENNIDTCSLENISNLCQESLLVYIKLFIIPYADDTVLLSVSAEGLQRALTCFDEYCDIWKLKVNTSKTMIVIFSKNKVKNDYGFKIYDKIIDIQDSYSYLGELFLIIMETSVPQGKNY